MQMAKLHSLIKFQRHDLEEKRKRLAVLNAELENMRNQKKNILDKLNAEKNLAAVDVDVARNFGVYLNRVLKECAVLDKKIADKLDEIQAATHVVQDAYLEVKKLEVTQDKRDQEEEDRLDRIEVNTLDEIGLETFRRKDNGTV
jgi:flagellar FliJ protein